EKLKAGLGRLVTRPQKAELIALVGEVPSRRPVRRRSMAKVTLAKHAELASEEPEREITLAETQRRGDRKGREKTLARSHLRVSASLRDNLPTLTLASFTCLARVVFLPSLR